ncbi:MAG: hypothetical protein ACM3SP_21610 [Chloroflexota bacterium]
MVKELTIENLRSVSVQVGLEISDEELQRLLPGVNRARQQAAELRGFLDSNNEPAGAFDASKKSGK